MGWAINYIKQLKEGNTIKFRPRGNSMTGKIDNGNLVTIEPINDYKIKKGDIVLCKVNGKDHLHLVKAIRGDQYQIANNHGHINGWTNQKSIFGVCVKVEK